MIFVDSAFLLALVSPRDSLHPRAQAWAAAVREPLLVTEYVLWEVVNSLSSPADRPKAHAVVSRIRSASDWEVVAASPDLFEAGMRLSLVADRLHFVSDHGVPPAGTGADLRLPFRTSGLPGSVAQRAVLIRQEFLHRNVPC